MGFSPPRAHEDGGLKPTLCGYGCGVFVRPSHDGQHRCGGHRRRDAEHRTSGKGFATKEAFAVPNEFNATA
jgi:hypothetical protein